jgi:hypothetical protein
VIFEVVRRCPHCGREVRVSPLAFEENPYCVVCLPERLAEAARPGHVERRGQYGVFIPREPGKPSSGE